LRVCRRNSCAKLDFIFFQTAHRCYLICEDMDRF
jgi:hypothetical protein